METDRLIQCLTFQLNALDVNINVAPMQQVKNNSFNHGTQAMEHFTSKCAVYTINIFKYNMPSNAFCHFEWILVY